MRSAADRLVALVVRDPAEARVSGGDEDFDDLVAIDDGEARVAVPRVCTAGGATTKADLPITCG
jgi:hypothetical protein